MKIEIEAVEGDRAQLYQWDLNRRLILTGFGPDTQAHFGQGDAALVVAAYDDGGVLYADIPNICLQRAGMLYVYIYSPANTRTRTAVAFSVWARPKPEDYVYTETETLTYRKLEAKIGDLENLNTKDKSSLVSAVNEALKTSGGYGAVTYTEQNLTDAQQSQARKNIGALGTGALPDAINDALAQAKESGAFDGAPGKDGINGKDGAPGANGSDGVTPTIGDNGNWYLGDTDTGKPSRGETGPAGKDGADGKDGAAGADGKSAYQYAQDGGYTGTEAEFAEKLAQEKFANPNALTFTGAVTGSYDGSAPLSVEIPSGGGGSGGAVSWKLIRTINIVSGTSIYSFNTDNNGNAFRIKNFLILIDSYPTNGYLEIKPNGNFSFVQKSSGKKNSPFSFMMKRVTDGRYILENSNTNNSIFERTISNEYSSFGEFTSFSLWFSVDPASDTTMYILGEDV